MKLVKIKKNKLYFILRKSSQRKLMGPDEEGNC